MHKKENRPIQTMQVPFSAGWVCYWKERNLLITRHHTNGRFYFYGLERFPEKILIQSEVNFSGYSPQAVISLVLSQTFSEFLSFMFWHTGTKSFHNPALKCFSEEFFMIFECRDNLIFAVQASGAVEVIEAETFQTLLVI